MALNKFDRDLDLLAELIRKDGHEEGDNTVIQFDHLIEISFETEGIGGSKIQHPWARGVSVPTIEEYDGQMSGEAVHVEFAKLFPMKFADIEKYRVSFAQLDDETVKRLWDEALKGDHFESDDEPCDPGEDNNEGSETMEAENIDKGKFIQIAEVALDKLIEEKGHVVGEIKVLDFEHTLPIQFWFENIDGKHWYQYPWATGFSVRKCNGISHIYVEFDKNHCIKCGTDSEVCREMLNALDVDSIKKLWEEAKKGDFPKEGDVKSIAIKKCPKCGGDVRFNHPTFDGGTYMSCKNCNYAPQVETWAETDYEAAIKWNNLPREEAPYNCEDMEKTAKDEETQETQEMNTKNLINDLVGSSTKKCENQNNYLHVEIPEIRVKHGSVIRDENGNIWMFLTNDLPAPEFRPLYKSCRKVVQEEVEQDGCGWTVQQMVTELPDDEEVRAEGENSASDYTAEDLGLITQNAIEEDLAKLKPIVANLLQECIKYAKSQQTSCEVSVDLGGRNSLANKKAEKIEGILKSKGFVEVKWHYGDGSSFKENVHVFFIRWRVPDKTQATLHQ